MNNNDKGPSISQSPIQGWAGVAKDIEADLLSLGFTPEDMEKPKWWTSGYLTAGRMPVSDLALEKPLLMPDISLYAENECVKTEDSLLGHFRIAAELADGVSWDKSEYNLHALSDLEKALNTAKENLPDKIKDLIDKFKKDETIPSVAANVLEALILAASRADELRREAFVDLTEIGVKALDEQLPSFYYPTVNGKKQFVGYTDDLVPESAKILTQLRKVRFSPLIEAGRITALASDFAKIAFQEALANNPKWPLKEYLLDVETSLGRFGLAGAGDNIHEKDFAILIDLGGNDIYLNNAGGSRPSTMAAAFNIDLSGDDIYRGGDFCQGAGVGGCGSLIDFSGNDNYFAQSYSQGAALCGFSFFYEGGGDDVYSAHLGAQCFAIFGYSVFLELDGWDSYRVNILGQSFAGTLGVSLMDEFRGNDHYRAGGKYGFYGYYDASSGQGTAMGMRPWPIGKNLVLHGGVAMLNERRGDDSYSTMAFGQGASYLFSLGMLVDSQGEDRYLGSVYCQGTGCHLSAGTLLDKEGNDDYSCWGYFAGSSIDKGAGTFLDEEGDDAYKGCRGLAMAGKIGSFGAFADLRGNDQYLGQSNTIAFPIPPSREDLYANCYFLDYGGKDYYLPEGFGNNSSKQTEPFGRFADLERETLKTKSRWAPIAMEAKDLGKPALNRMNSLQTLERFSALGHLDQKTNLNDASSIASWGHPHAQKQLIEWVMRMISEGALSEDAFLQLLALKDSTSADVRLLPLFAAWQIPQQSENARKCFEELLLKDPEAKVRAMAAVALGKMEGEFSPDAMLAALRNDGDWRVRRSVALNAKGEKDAPVMTALIYALKHDSEDKVRSACAKTLGEMSAKEEINEALIKSAAIGDAFTRFYSARGLVNAYKDKFGVKTLIDLYANAKTRRLLASVFGSSLSAPTGRSFPTPEDWRQWWNKNAKTWDMEAMLKTQEQISEASKLYDQKKYDKARDILQAILDKDPDNANAKNLLKDLWEKIAEASLPQNPALAVRCGQDVEKVYYHSEFQRYLAIALYLNGQKEEAIAKMEKVCKEQERSNLKHYYFLDELEAMKKGSFQWKDK